MIQNSKHIDHCFDGGFYFFLMDLSQKHGELAYLWIFLTFYDHCRSKSAVAAEVCFEIEVVWDGNIFAELTQPLFIYISSKRTQKFFIQDQMNCSFQVVLTFKFQLGRHRGGSEVRTKDAQDK